MNGLDIINVHVKLLLIKIP